jgi:adenosine deaminase
MRAAAITRVCKFYFIACFLFATAGPEFAQNPAVARRGAFEQRTARALETARTDPLNLRAFLVAMPKGTDLHNHLSGAVYAESWIRAAAQDGACVDRAKMSFSRPPRANGNSATQPPCGAGNVPAADAYRDQHLYDALIDAFSMRGFVPSSEATGHDHFFDTFDHFGGDAIDPSHTGDWLDEVAVRAASQNEQYLELMVTPDFQHTISLANQTGWEYDFARMRNDLLARGLRDDVTRARAMFDQAEVLRSQREHCGEQNEARACRVEIRYLYQILRGFPKQTVFAQTLLGFEIAAADPRVVGINYVMPEDGYTSMSDYALHMRIVGFLHTLYPKVHISLHAGELAPGLVPPDGLCCHIRLAVEEARAERIGHGVDVMYEDRPYDLLKEMAKEHIMVEINLTSEDVILGVSGKEHPLPIYRKFGVPVAFSTDDEGVSRIDLTHEYVRGVQTFGLNYSDLKQMVRTGMEHAFLPGDSLWRDRDVFKVAVLACSSGALGEEKPSAACAAFLRKNEKANQQWELERRFRRFESDH